MKHWKDEDGEMRGEGLIGEGLREECGRGCGESGCHGVREGVRGKEFQRNTHGRHV